ncbi:MAG TPA: hypothetical protein PKW21_04780 [Rhabdaerophilum sp.]|nr:hypothetical protein [Rhabdaerophilum sp.]
MIVLSEVHHSTKRHGKTIDLLDNAPFAFGEGHVGLLVDSAAAAEVFFDLLVGYIKPKQGRIRRQGSVSWPIGRVMAFRNQLTGRKNLRMLCSLYDLDYEECEHSAYDMMKIEKYFDRQTIEWPRELLLEFAYFAALLPTFDVYLVEGATNTSNDAFNAKWEKEFRRRITGKRMIYQSLSERFTRAFATSAVALQNGRLTHYDNLDTAYAAVSATDDRIDAGSREILPYFDDTNLI